MGKQVRRLVSVRRLVLIAGFIKPSGIKCAQVENDRKQRYFVTVRPDGRATCTCAARKACYHIAYVDALPLQPVEDAPSTIAPVVSSSAVTSLARPVVIETASITTPCKGVAPVAVLERMYAAPLNGNAGFSLLRR